MFLICLFSCAGAVPRYGLTHCHSDVAVTIILVISMFKSHLAARQNVPLTTIKLKLKVGQSDNRA